MNDNSAAGVTVFGAAVGVDHWGVSPFQMPFCGIRWLIRFVMCVQGMVMSMFDRSIDEVLTVAEVSWNDWVRIGLMDLDVLYTLI